MEGAKKTEDLTGIQKKRESKIPKPARFSSAKVTSTKNLVEKKTVQSSKTTKKMATVTSSKMKQAKITNLPKNAKRVSVAKTTKDAMNHLQDENLKSEVFSDHATESAAGIKVPDKENATKRAPLKEKFSGEPKKQSGSLSKKPSESDLMPGVAFRGIRFTAKRNTCRNFDMFQKVEKESNDRKTVNPPEPCTKALKTSDSAKATASKEIERSNDGNLEDSPTVTTESSKAASLTSKEATVTSSKVKKGKIAHLPKNVKRMSVAKISKDVMNHLQDENLKSDDHITESAVGIKVPDKENATKRAPLKETFSGEPQKQSGSLSKKASASYLMPDVAFGGIRFTAKRNACRNFDTFQKVEKESKDRQPVNPPEPCTEELKTTDSAKATASKEIERHNEGNLGDSPTVTIESSKAASLTVKETTLKKYTAFGGIRFSPKWQSTPLKPDLFDNIQKVSNHDKELCTPDSSAKGPERILNSTKLDITITLDETLQPPTKEPKNLNPSSITVKEIDDKMYPAFAGMRLVRKRKSTHPKPDIFKIVQEDSKLDGQESPLSDTSTKEMKTTPVSTTTTIKVEAQHSDNEKLELLATQKPESSKNDDASKNVKKVVPPAMGGLRFKPRQKNLHDVFETQKSNVVNQIQS